MRLAPSLLAAFLVLSPAAAQPSAPTPLVQTVVASGLSHPWSMAFLPDGHMLVTEKDGGLMRVDPDGRVTPITGIPDLDNRRLSPIDNSGLFDIALHPDFARNGRLFLTYSAGGDGYGATTRLLSARLESDRLLDAQVLFEATPRSDERFHYGGGLLIGPDRLLYLTVGERFFMEGAQPAFPVAQDVGDRRGKIYRFTLDGQPAPGNPDFGPGAVPGLYAMGIRAAQGLALSPDGAIWFSEHGPVGGDEVNMLVPGANYGWPTVTAGRFRDQRYHPQALSGAVYIDPVYTWTDRTVAPTGMTFVTSGAFPAWKGDLLVAGLGQGFLMRLDIESGRVRDVEYLMRGIRLRNVRQGPDGNLYLLTDEADGRVIRLDPVS